jgi:hypothetical protein
MLNLKILDAEGKTIGEGESLADVISSACKSFTKDRRDFLVKDNPKEVDNIVRAAVENFLANGEYELVRIVDGSARVIEYDGI